MATIIESVLKLLTKKSRSSQSPTEPSLIAHSDQADPSTTEYQKPSTISEAYNNPRYNNKIVIESPEGLFSTTSGDKAVEAFRKLQDKYPDSPPVLTVIPKGTLLTTTTEPAQSSTNQTSTVDDKE